MPAIGILLPGSTLYPSIGIDFLQGIKSCFNFYSITGVDLPVFPIGYGLKEEEIYKQSEKFLLSDNADAVVVYADTRFVKMLSPLFAAAGKLLVITNGGANYPPVSTGFSNTLCHSLNDSLYSFLTGKLCSRQSGDKTAISATSFFDGGYHHFHAMSNAFALANGEIKFNYVSPFKKEEFSIAAMADFIRNNPSVKDLLCVYSGDLARYFYKEIKILQEEFDLRLYGSPMMFDNTAGDFTDTNPYVKQIQGYTGWVTALDNQHNKNFLAYYKEGGKQPNLFSLQGWETALLLIEYLQQTNGGADTNTAISQIKSKTLQSPRGTLQIDDTNSVLGPAYLVSATNNLEITVEDVIENVTTAQQEMLMQVPDTEFSGWRNTYLCI
jgi:branched-chain amino acid transport system substrate-binding protein